MCDETDLPDHDYESIYGREAMLARIQALERVFAAQAARIQAQGYRAILPPTQE